MITAPQLSTCLPRRRRTSAFTMIELAVASAVSAIVLGGLATSYLYALKGYRAVSNYTDIHGDGRHAVDLFARDVRGVATLISWSSNNLSVKVPTAFDSIGRVTSNKTVTYT